MDASKKEPIEGMSLVYRIADDGLLLWYRMQMTICILEYRLLVISGGRKKNKQISVDLRGKLRDNKVHEISTFKVNHQKINLIQ